MNPTVVLKNPKGWFAAGAEVQQALSVLSDGAFKLFVYLCLHARRDTGVLEATQTELARGLHKGAAAIRSYLHEMETAGICRCHFSRSHARRGRVEVTPSWWPYQKPESSPSDEPAEAFLFALKKLLQVRPCVQTAFSTADDILARNWFQRGLSLERIEQAILLGCARKYVSWRNDPRHGPIRSLRYFEPLLAELDQQPPAPAYWDYLRLRLQRLESLWVQAHPPAAPGESRTAASTSPPDRTLENPTLPIPTSHRRSSTMSAVQKERR
jgi:hypothetical protein